MPAASRTVTVIVAWSEPSAVTPVLRSTLSAECAGSAGPGPSGGFYCDAGQPASTSNDNPTHTRRSITMPPRSERAREGASVHPRIQSPDPALPRPCQRLAELERPGFYILSISLDSEKTEIHDASARDAQIPSRMRRMLPRRGLKIAARRMPAAAGPERGRDRASAVAQLAFTSARQPGSALTRRWRGARSRRASSAGRSGAAPGCG